MAKDRFFIGPLETGLQNDVRPWLIPDDAFEILNNAYIFRGRLRKRFGTRLMNGDVAAAVEQLTSRVRISLGNTDGNGDISVTVPGATFKVGQLFSISAEIFTVNATGTPGTLLITGSATLATYDTTTGALVINGAAATTACFFYPAEPIMGLITYDTANINDEPLYAFDTQFVYQFTSGGWSRLGTALWTGSNSQFMWGANWRGVLADDKLLFISNFNAADQIKFWNGSTWTTINPIFNSTGNTIESARCIVPFKDRLLFLNVIEEIAAVDRLFPNRCRFSQNGSPLEANAAFREDIAGRGGYIDAPTSEAIITCEFLKDRLIVFFERSTWELVYTGNEILPFRWQQLNTELGVESTFSIVPFDKVVIGVGNVGVHACNGANVERIDQKIPDEVFNIHNENEGVLRVYGIRDYVTEMIYWAFPSDDPNPTFPNRILAYNYKTGSWAFFDDSITAFGYFQQQNDITWVDMESEWQTTDVEWVSGVLQSQFRDVVAGNQEGFVFIVVPEGPGSGRNAPSLQLTDITFSGDVVTLAIADHNLIPGDFIIIENAQGITALNDLVFRVQTITTTTVTLSVTLTSGTYTGAGTAARISRIDIRTKQYNFYADKGRNVSIEKVAFMVDRTVNGEVTVDYAVSSSNIFLLEPSQEVTGTGAILGNNILETSPFGDINQEESDQARLWHPVYFQSNGECVQLRIFLSDAQMVDTNIAWSDFELHAMLFYANPTASRLQ